jgi:hypothetical protein
MRGNVIRALTFASVTFVLLVLADAAMWGGFQGAQPEAQHSELLRIHVAFHAAVLTLAFIGALIGFLPVRKRLLPIKGAVILAVIFSMLSFFAVIGAFQIGGIAAAGIWLVAGSATVAFVGGRMLSSPQAHV